MRHPLTNIYILRIQPSKTLEVKHSNVVVVTIFHKIFEIYILYSILIIIIGFIFPQQVASHFRTKCLALRYRTLRHEIPVK